MTPSQLSNRALEWAQQISAAWTQSVESVIQSGRLLIEAKNQLSHGEWETMCAGHLPFKVRTAERLMAIARDERLSNPTHVSLLPTSWGTLYELTRLDDDEFRQRIDDGTINPEMERRDIKVARHQKRRSEREADLGRKQRELPQEQFGIIYADPPWHFEVWSEARGVEKSAQNQYPTLTVEQICALPIKQLVAPDCLLFLWITAPRLFRAPELFAAWSPDDRPFEYVTHYVWDKEKIGTGYWNRNRHEILLLARHGDVPAPLPSQLDPSVYREPSTRHSAKPSYYCELIEKQFPTLAKIELFRRGSPRAGWAAWGNEATEAA